MMRSVNGVTPASAVAQQSNETEDCILRHKLSGEANSGISRPRECYTMVAPSGRAPMS
jgi:hypothetical protein